MQELKLMIFSGGSDNEIKCGLASRYFKRISSIPSKKEIIPEIEKYKPDFVVLKMNLFKRIHGLEVKRKISDRFDIPVWYE